jgi:hypothetical protein
MKPVELVLRMGEKGREGKMEGVKLTKIYWKHIYKYHNVSPCITIYAIKITITLKTNRHTICGIRGHICKNSVDKELVIASLYIIIKN